MNVMKQLVVVAALLGTAAFGYYYGLPLLQSEDGGGPGGRGPAEAAPEVITEPVRLEPERTVVEAVGTAEAIRSATLYPATSGEVDAVHIAPDALVEAGDVLLELDHRAEELAVALARVRVEDARRLLQRYEGTQGTGAVPESTIDEARTALESARIELQQAEVDLEDRRVVAPFAGRVDRTDVDVGDRIGPDTAITTLDDRSTLLVRFPVPEVFLGRLSVGQAVSVSPGMSRDRTVSGEIVDLGSRIDPVTRSIEARARVDNSADRLRPGMSFAVSIDLRGNTYALVPEVSVQWGGDGPFLWVVRRGQAARVPVSIVQRQEGYTMVDGDLEDGELVVVEGIQRMREGTDVSILSPEPVSGS